MWKPLSPFHKVTYYRACLEAHHHKTHLGITKKTQNITSTPSEEGVRSESAAGYRHMLGQLVTGRQKESGVTKNLVRSRHLRGIQGGPPGGTFRYTYILIYIF